MAQVARIALAPAAAWLVASWLPVPAADAASPAANSIAEKFSGTPARAVAPQARPAQPDTEAARRADEAEMLARARAEAEQRANAEQARANAEQARVEAEQALATRAATRAGELARLSEKLRSARAARDARVADQAVEAANNARAEPPRTEAAAAPTPPAPATTPARGNEITTASAQPARLGMAETRPQPATTRAQSNLYTVLLVMAPGRRGIRRFNPTGDPVLCTGEGCYVSGGFDAPARFMGGRKALNFANTFGGRAGACQHSLGCVFRHVEIDPARGPAFLQPVDLHVLRHDRREAQLISSDSNCRAVPGRIACAQGIDAGNYALWIVPEHLAELAGPTGLAVALEHGLIGPRSAEALADDRFTRR